MASTSTVRRALAGTIGAAAIMGATFAGASALALADPPPPPPPGCSAGDFEQVRADVSTATSTYFFTHPDVNAFFSSLKGQPKDQTRGQVMTYLGDNPQTKADLEGIRQPMQDFKNRCQ